MSRQGQKLGRNEVRVRPAAVRNTRAKRVARSHRGMEEATEKWMGYILPTSSSAGISIRLKANNFFPRSFSEAPR